MSFHSQHEQDRLLHECLLKGMRQGTFVDIGAYDGVTFSNSLFFEETLGWRGVCIEADPASFAQLQRNRPTAINLNVAAGAAPGKASFVQVDGYAQMLSGFADKVDSNRIDREVTSLGGSKRILTVDVARVADLLRERGIADVHYLSLDVEGAELEVLSGIDFSAVRIHAMTVETNSRWARRRVLRLLGSNFVYVGRCGADVFLVNREGMFVRRASVLRSGIARTRGPWWKRMSARWLRALKARTAIAAK